MKRNSVPTDTRLNKVCSISRYVRYDVTRPTDIDFTRNIFQRHTIENFRDIILNTKWNSIFQCYCCANPMRDLIRYLMQAIPFSLYSINH